MLEPRQLPCWTDWVPLRQLPLFGAVGRERSEGSWGASAGCPSCGLAGKEARERVNGLGRGLENHCFGGGRGAA